MGHGEMGKGAFRGCFCRLVSGVEQHAERCSQQFEGLQAGPIDQAAMTGQCLDLGVTLCGGTERGR